MRGINIHCFLRGKPINAKKNAFLKFNKKYKKKNRWKDQAFDPWIASLSFS